MFAILHICTDQNEIIKWALQFKLAQKIWRNKKDGIEYGRKKDLAE